MKHFWSKQIWTKKKFGEKKIWTKKKFVKTKIWSESPKNFLVQKIYDALTKTLILIEV